MLKKEIAGSKLAKAVKICRYLVCMYIGTFKYCLCHIEEYGGQLFKQKSALELT
jgi:hypothetical protein